MFGIWETVNGEANDGVIFIRTIEFNVIIKTIVFR